MSYDPSTSGFQLTESYVVGQGGEELTMLDGSNNWQRTNGPICLRAIRQNLPQKRFLNEQTMSILSAAVGH